MTLDEVISPALPKCCTASLGVGKQKKNLAPAALRGDFDSHKHSSQPPYLRFCQPDERYLEFAVTKYFAPVLSIDDTIK